MLGAVHGGVVHAVLGADSGNRRVEGFDPQNVPIGVQESHHVVAGAVAYHPVGLSGGVPQFLTHHVFRFGPHNLIGFFDIRGE